MENKKKIYIDANVWISYYKQAEQDKLSEGQREGIRQLFQKIDDGSVIAVTSAILLVQVLTASAEKLETAYDGRRGLMVAADDAICKGAREFQLRLYESCNKVLSPEDAIHLYTAYTTGCQLFVTFDRRQKNNQLSPLRDKEDIEEILNLKIVGPEDIEGQPTLPFESDNG